MNPSGTNYLLINSSDNQKVKLARAVRDGRERDKIFVEGLRLCEELIKTDPAIDFVFVTAKFLQNSRGAELVNNLSSKQNIFELNEKIFASLSDTKQSQGIIAIAGKPATGKTALEKNLADDSILLLLHEINNPSNLGAILRTAEATDVSGIITTKNSTDAFSPKALRGAMGASFRLPFWTNADYFEALEWAHSRKIKSVCADIKSEVSYTEINWRESKLIIFGSEGHGLTAAEMANTDETLLIPMDNHVESLNIAVACGVILFESKRQRSSSQ